jgi:hypothetical protein
MMSVFVVAAMLSFVVLPLSAQGKGNASLGISLGAAIPGAATANVPSDGLMSFNWGFYVNLPLLETFHLTPSSELYKFGNQNATDFDMAFKFIVPLQSFALYVGLSPGLTAVSALIAPHIGVLGGASFNLVSNLDAFVQAKYDFIFDGNQNTNVLHVNGGVLFNF